MSERKDSSLITAKKASCDGQLRTVRPCSCCERCVCAVPETRYRRSVAGSHQRRGLSGLLVWQWHRCPDRVGRESQSAIWNTPQFENWGWVGWDFRPYLSRPPEVSQIVSCSVLESQGNRSDLHGHKADLESLSQYGKIVNLRSRQGDSTE